MLFKIGLTVVIIVSVYMFYALHNTTDHSDDNGEKVIEDTDPTEVVRNEEAVKDKKDVEIVANSPPQVKDNIHIVVVACGDRLKDVIVLMKSALLLTNTPLTFHLFIEEEIQKMLKKMLLQIPKPYLEKAQIHVYNIQYPAGENAVEWKKYFKPCASQRLFIPDILKDLDAVLYVDTDIIFLEPVDYIWSSFKKFNSTQLAALAPESEDYATGWYNRFARHPYYGPLGVNSGVMLMNLTRLREINWIDSIIRYYKEYKLKTTWGDQDLINIFFHFFPEKLYVYPCEWNFRSDHCMYMSTCKGAENEGAHILHGSRQIWHNDKQPAFKAVFTAFAEHLYGENLNKLVDDMKQKLSQTQHTNCGKVGHIFTKRLQAVVEEMNIHSENEVHR